MSRTTWHRIGLAVIFISSVSVGAWAQLAPQSFYDDFPGGGRVWIAVDGPYNEHLIRDVGGLNLALALVALVAIVRPEPLLVAAAAGAALIFGAPHLLYHLLNLDVLETADQVGVVVSLVGAVIVPLALLIDSARTLLAADPHAGVRKLR
ncbi:MAG: hypothetical protein OES57_16885 [Acidimicrobiia bacterium]|nr:hypothetical protein [Acidimicrobiia bacterium]